MPIPPSSSGVLSPEALKPSSPKTADDINELFSRIDDETPAKEESKEDEVVEAKTEDEGDELELIEPEEDIEKLDLSEKADEVGEIDTPPRKKEILKEYPELFKKFPFLEKMLYRDRQYNELFGSFDDAKEVAEKSENFSKFEDQLLSGNTEEVLKGVKEADERAFNIIVDDYLPTLAKVDKDAYYHVVGNLNKRLIMEMVKEANDTNNEDLKQAALLVNQFVFGNSKFEAPSNKVDKSETANAEKNEAEQERLSFVRERFETVRDDLQSQVDNTLRATISDYIDPRGVMSPYVKKNAVSDAMKYLGSAIASDPSVVGNLDNLWRASLDSKFSRDSQGRIKSYYLSKAKRNLKSAILKARAEALKDSRPANRDKEVDDREREQEEEVTPRSGTRRIPTGKPSQPKGKNDMRKGESVADFFMRD